MSREGFDQAWIKNRHLVREALVSPTDPLETHRRAGRSYFDSPRIDDRHAS